ncbi:MAG: cation diffusion facilitator family transporter, partial [Pseudomonadota bacterium]|nr:cation diffusion facilitator family transporter [Pseudomonadota bacterium]
MAVDHPRRLAVAVGLNLALTAVQVAGGISAGSLALIADALHNFSDAGALIIALLAFRVARRPSDSRRTFGYRRAEVIGALINYTGLVIIGCYLLLEAALRALDPQPVAGWIVVWVAAVALLVDVATVALTRSGARHSMNMRAAYLHNLADALTSLLVIGSGIAIILFGFYFADIVATLLVAAWVLRHALSEMGEAIRLLMNSVPGH